jgi:hypothetical protein
MRIFCLLMVLAVAGLTSLAGCSGDGDGGSGGALAQGTATIPASGAVTIATVQVTVPGTLQAHITWSGTPTELLAVFQQVSTSHLHGLTQSPSTLVSTAAVGSADVAAGSDWRLIGASPSAVAVSVQYEIRFIPD